MLKRILFGTILVFLSTSINAAQSSTTISGVNWLVVNQNIDSSWGGPSSSASTFKTTAAAVYALRLSGKTASAATDGLNWLSGQTIDSVNFASDRLLANAIAGLDTAGDISQLVAWENTIDGLWGLDGEYSNDISEIAIALQALHAANYSDTTLIGQSLNYLTANQNTDGGWGLSANDTSNSFVTSAVLRTLAAYNSVFINQNSINQGIGVPARPSKH